MLRGTFRRIFEASKVSFSWKKRSKRTAEFVAVGLGWRWGHHAVLTLPLESPPPKMRVFWQYFWPEPFGGYGDEDVEVYRRTDRFYDDGLGGIAVCAPRRARQRQGMDEVFLVLFVHKKNALALAIDLILLAFGRHEGPSPRLSPEGRGGRRCRYACTNVRRRVKMQS